MPSSKGTTWPREGLSLVQGHPESPRLSSKPISRPLEVWVSQRRGPWPPRPCGFIFETTFPGSCTCWLQVACNLGAPGLGVHLQGGWQDGTGGVGDGPKAVSVRPQVEQAAEGSEGLPSISSVSSWLSPAGQVGGGAVSPLQSSRGPLRPGLLSQAGAPSSAPPPLNHAFPRPPWLPRPPQPIPLGPGHTPEAARLSLSLSSCREAGKAGWL